MQIEVLADFLDNLYLMNAININPGYSGRAFEGNTLFNRLSFLFLKLCFVIVNYGNLHCFHPLLADIIRSPRWETRLFFHFFEKSTHFSHCSFLSRIMLGITI